MATVMVIIRKADNFRKESIANLFAIEVQKRWDFYPNQV